MIDEQDSSTVMIVLGRVLVRTTMMAATRCHTDEVMTRHYVPSKSWVFVLPDWWSTVVKYAVAVDNIVAIMDVWSTRPVITADICIFRQRAISWTLQNMCSRVHARSLRPT